MWVKITNSENAVKKLRRFQRMALLSMGAFYPSTPTAGLEVATYTTPIQIHLKQEAAMAYLRTKHLTKFDRDGLYIFGKPKKTGHRQFIETILIEIGYVDLLSDEIPQRFN